MFDLIVLGAGPAGLAATERAARLGAKVCLVDTRRAGGTDAVSGVLPARTLAHIAHLKRSAEQFDRYGLKGDAPELDYGRALDRCREVVEESHAAKERLAQKFEDAGNLTVMEEVGDAQFVDPYTIRLADGRELEAERFIISTGGHPRRPSFPGNELALVPSELWQPGAVLPSRAVIVGTGHTGVQVASILADFGCQVTLLERGPQLLAHEDRDVAAEIGSVFCRRGIQIVTGFGTIREITRRGADLVVAYGTGDRQEVPCDAAILSLGWVPNTESIGLAAAGVEVGSRGFIDVDDTLRTSQSHIYAAGDVTGRMMLVTAASHEGYLAAGNALLGTADPVRHAIVSTGGYPFPEHGSVGMTEERARETHDCEVSLVPYRKNPRAIIDGKTDGFCKLIVDRRSHLILGAHVVGERAVEVVQLVATGMATGLRVDQLAALDLAYPTYVQIVGEAAYRICLALNIELHEVDFSRRLDRRPGGATVERPLVA